jgi:hypothetical protein
MSAQLYPMKHTASLEDRNFRRDFESHTFPAAQFRHRAHLRLAYVYLCEHDTDEAHEMMRSAILSFLAHLGADRAKYHETVTRAWIMAVRHFMEKSPGSESFESLAQQHPEMLDSKIMLTHYSAEVLSSPEARVAFVQPNLDPIPRYARRSHGPGIDR